MYRRGRDIYIRYNVFQFVRIFFYVGKKNLKTFIIAALYDAVHFSTPSPPPANHYLSIIFFYRTYYYYNMWIILYN